MKLFRKLLCAGLLLLGFARVAEAQYTTVTATVRDASGNVYTNCSFNVDFMYTASQPAYPSLNGSTFQQSFGGNHCTAAGTFSLVLADNTQVQPKDATSRWKFSICDSTGVFCFSTLIQISGSSQDISATLQPLAPLLPGQSQFALAKIDFCAGCVAGGVQSANIAATNVYAVPTGKGGMYAVNCYTVVTQAPTTSGTLPFCQVLYTDNDTGVVETATFTNSVAASPPPIGTQGQTFTGGGSTPVINVRAGTTIQVQTTGYVSTGAAVLQYALHLKLTFIGT